MSGLLMTLVLGWNGTIAPRLVGVEAAFVSAFRTDQLDVAPVVGPLSPNRPVASIVGSLFSFWDGAWPYLIMILGFSLIVFVHELGHFAVAKWADIRVERFAIGFGRELFGLTRGETRYSFNVLPLGGYVKMLGQEDFDDKTLELLVKDDPRAFINKPVGHRMAVVSAGVVMNVLFAGLLFMIVFMIGMKAPSTRIGSTEPDSPAERAGLLPGDLIESINGERILEFRDVSMAIQLAAPHEPIEFIVRRGDERLQPIYVTPDYRRPENTREPRRQVIGILPGFTREIAWVGPEIEVTREDQPRPGDLIAEVDGVPVTEANVDAMFTTLVYAKEVVVERPDPKNLDAPHRRYHVEIPPQLGVYPSDSRDPASINVLGLTPLARFGAVDPDGRAGFAGINVGDTVLSWDDVPYPTRAVISRAISEQAERDIPFTVRKSDGRTVRGFVRPKRNRVGPGTIQASVEPLPADVSSDDGPQARFVQVRPRGQADRAGIEPGDLIVRLNELDHPSSGAVHREIRSRTGRRLSMVVRKPDGSRLTVSLVPEEPGSIDANYTLVADDVLITGSVVVENQDRPTPASVAGIPAGANIEALNGNPVTTWRGLIDQFRLVAGTSAKLTYRVNRSGDLEERTVEFPVPHSLRTLLGVGPEAQIVSVDGRTAIRTRTNRGDEEVHVGYHEGTRSLLHQLIGQRKVPVVFRPHPAAPVETKYIDVTEDMVDPWLGRIVYVPNVLVGQELITLKGANVLDALRIGVHKTYYFILQVYETMNRMIFSRSVALENMSGPLGIVSVGGQIARAGLVEFLFFMAIISANLAVINFLPLPIVDGGLMVFLIIEKIKGSPVSLRVQVLTQMVGLFLIIGAFLYVTYNDLLRIVG